MDYTKMPVAIVGFPYSRTEEGKGTLKAISWAEGNDLPEYGTRMKDYSGTTWLILGVDEKHRIVTMVSCVK